MAANELVLCDLSVRVDGFWADSCTTICLGKPTNAMKRLHDVLLRALHAAIEMATPGTVAGSIDAKVRGIIAQAGFSYSFHSGHGVGVNYMEEPRIVPHGQTTIGPGMVLALEPAAFGGGIGGRVEHLVEVTPSGPKVLTDLDLELT
jgi:Xaa-Pro aminopeptidase